jgi:hypothetical protein
MFAVDALTLSEPHKGCLLSLDTEQGLIRLSGGNFLRRWAQRDIVSGVRIDFAIGSGKQASLCSQQVNASASKAEAKPMARRTVLKICACRFCSGQFSMGWTRFKGKELVEEANWCRMLGQTARPPRPDSFADKTKSEPWPVAAEGCRLAGERAGRDPDRRPGAE